ncbi:MAG: sulfurtransferase [Desulfomonile sp.]|nr:sulfurtransferase [Desulfomonile sp.]
MIKRGHGMCTGLISERLWMKTKGVVINMKRKIMLLMRRLRSSIAVVLAILALCLTTLSPAWAVEDGAYPNPDFLVTTKWLAEHLNDPNVKIIDRQDVFPGENIYAEGHIPNSIRMTTDAIKGMRLGVQEMLVVKDLIRFLEENGILPEHRVVFVSRSDRFPAATRALWAMELLGHKKVSVLDGGIDKWKAEKRPMTSEVPRCEKTSYKVNLKRDLLMTGDELAGYVGGFKELGIVPVDCRRPEEYSGTKMSRASAKMGRIPGSVNIFFENILTGQDYKEFKSAHEIKKLFDSQGVTPEKNAVFSCVSGCFGTVAYVAARLLGFSKASVYDGGWIEWSQKDYPVEGGGLFEKTERASTSPAKARPPAPRPSPPGQGC